jgi:hypothetical protein
LALELGATRDAFLEAGTSPATANRAAGELAASKTRLSSLDGRVGVLTMAGANITLTILGFGSSFARWSKLGDLASQIARIGTAH